MRYVVYLGRSCTGNVCVYLSVTLLQFVCKCIFFFYLPGAAEGIGAPHGSFFGGCGCCGCCCAGGYAGGGAHGSLAGSAVAPATGAPQGSRAGPPAAPNPPPRVRSSNVSGLPCGV